MMTDTCGPTSPTPFAYYDPDTCSVKMSQATFPWDSTPSSPTLPGWGSMRGGELFERPTPAPLTAARDCSSSLLLPTSRATDGEKGGPNQVNGRGVRDSLPGLAPTLLPTPTSRDHKGRIQRDDQTCLPGALLPVPVAVAVLLPTPKATNNDNQQNLDRYGPNLGMALMPEQYEWTSAPTPPLSPAGNTSPDATLPFPLNLDATTDPA